MRIEHAAGKRVQRRDHRACRQHDIVAHVWHRRVAAPAFDDDFEQVARRHHRAVPDRHPADGQSGPVVQAIHPLHRESLEQPVFDHHLAAGFVLFGWLKNDMDGAAEPLRRCQIAGGAQQHGRMPIMPARMHLSRAR